jgi:hypothetical protein
LKDSSSDSKDIQKRKKAYIKARRDLINDLSQDNKKRLRSRSSSLLPQKPRSNTSSSSKLPVTNQLKKQRSMSALPKRGVLSKTEIEKLYSNFCLSCGYDLLPIDSTFCVRCGAKMNNKLN